MVGGRIAFVIWCFVSLIFVGIGLSALKADEPVGFWANSSKKPEVNDVDGYNKAMCKLWIGFAIVLCLFGLPLLAGQNSPLVILTVFGVMVEIIALIIIYVFVIEKKYEKK